MCAQTTNSNNNGCSRLSVSIKTIRVPVAAGNIDGCSCPKIQLCLIKYEIRMCVGMCICYSMATVILIVEYNFVRK